MSAWLDLLQGDVDSDVIERARRDVEQGGDSADFLLTRGCVPPRVVLAAMSAHHRLPAVNVDRYQADRDALALIPEETARRFNVLPLFRLKQVLYVALSNPRDFGALDFLRQLTGHTIEPVLAARRSIEAALNRAFLTREQSATVMDSIAADLTPKETERGGYDLIVEDGEAPAIKLVSHILSRGIQMGASDIHLEPFEKRIALRYRIDGILHEFPPPPSELFPPAVARIKVIANMNIAEKRLPQDGRIKMSVHGREYDLRVSILPSLIGEGVVLRVLDSSGQKKQLQDLGFSEAMRERYERLISRPYGLFLVTGPTGSGKSTTLYATLNRIFTPEKKIITVEDPVEYLQDGVHQVQVNQDIGFTFAEGLRSILRHDPDVIMVGEIRDQETAEIAIRSSLTGHMVFSTLHTNDTPSAVTRLLDMGIPSYLVLSSLTGVIGQRLLRRLCAECKTEVVLDGAQLSSLGMEALPEPARTFGPTGCTACNNTGYKGRVAIYELLEMTPAMRSLPGEQATEGEIRRAAQSGASGPFVTLRDSAIESMRAGVTSLDEVLRITIE